MGECLKHLETPHITTPPKSVPLVAPLLKYLRTNQGDIYTPQDFLGTFSFGIPENNMASYLAVQAVRTSFDDASGIVPYLLGLAEDPQQTMDVLRPIAHKGILTLDAMDLQTPGIKNGYIAALHGDAEECSLQVLNAADIVWGQLVNGIKAVAQRNEYSPFHNTLAPQAKAFRDNTHAQLVKLAKEAGGIEHLMTPTAISGIAGLQDYLTDVQASYTVPVLDDHANLLEAIIPDELRKTRTLRGLSLEDTILRNGGIAGHPYVRAISQNYALEQARQEMTERVASSG